MQRTLTDIKSTMVQVKTWYDQLKLVSVMAWCHQLTLVKVMAWNHQVTNLFLSEPMSIILSMDYYLMQWGITQVDDHPQKYVKHSILGDLSVIPSILGDRSNLRVHSNLGDTRRFHSNLSDGPTNWHRLYISIYILGKGIPVSK